MKPTLEHELRSGLSELGLTLGDAQIQALLDYLGWIVKWNRVYNLTAVRDEHGMLTQHLLDSLAVVQPLRRQIERLHGAMAPARLLDVGSGAGLPGVVLAIACPELEVSCVDTVAKKALFVRQVAAALRLPKLHALHARVETLSQRFDIVTSRAFATLTDFAQASAGALEQGGVWMALKGKEPQAEIAALPAAIEVFHVEPVLVPGLAAQRCLVWLRPRTDPG